LVKNRRKDPSQMRSKQTVDAILQAVVLLLNKNETAQITTNKIADTAGVSIGSLYQYFENKESILEKILIKILEENLELFERTLQKIPPNELEV